MANFKKVNQALGLAFPFLDIECVKGDGYAYFLGKDADQVASVYSNPSSTSTDDMIRMSIEEVSECYP